jgi:imidazolonepropionase-like amidohydrolase
MIGIGQTFVIRGVSALDESGSFEGPVDVHVHDGMITDVGSSHPANSAPTIDGAGLWLMPGVFDCHSHLGISSTDPLACLGTPITEWTLKAAQTARTMLEAGVTSARDVGGIDAGIRSAIDSGIIVGPRTQISINMLSQTGGHGDGFLSGPGFEMTSGYAFPDYPGRPPSVIDGVDSMRHTVRALLRGGADWIKLCTTGGVMAPTDDPLAAELTPDEIGTAVFEASRKGKPVVAHAIGGDGIDNAIDAGVRSIEHGQYLTEEQAAKMAAKGCFFVPTLAIVNDLMRMADAGEIPEYAMRKLDLLSSKLGEAVRIARAAGVPIALGCDYIDASQHGRNLEEIFLLHREGLPLEEALLAATQTGADLCGVGDRLGRIAPGYVFDAILFDEEPSDPSLFTRRGAVSGVFKGGEAVVPHPRLTEMEPIVG